LDKDQKKKIMIGAMVDYDDYCTFVQQFQSATTPVAPPAASMVLTPGDITPFPTDA
jgi:hypothetical protein